MKPFFSIILPTFNQAHFLKISLKSLYHKYVGKNIITMKTYPTINRSVVIIKGKSPFQPDKNHIHHLILSRTKNHSKATLIIVLFCILFLIIVQFLNRIL